MANIGHIEIEIRPTVTMEGAVTCVTMLNLFLDSNEEYRLEVGGDGKWHLTDGPRMRSPVDGRPSMPQVDQEANELWDKLFGKRDE